MNNNKIDLEKLFYSLVLGLVMILFLLLIGLLVYGLVLLAINYLVSTLSVIGTIIWFIFTILIYNGDDF